MFSALSMNPICIKDHVYSRTTAMLENSEVLAGCEVEFAGPAPGPRLDWHIANVTHPGPTGAPKTR